MNLPIPLHFKIHTEPQDPVTKIREESKKVPFGMTDNAALFIGNVTPKLHDTPSNFSLACWRRSKGGDPRLHHEV